ncbi:hypothetical protein CYY_003549 [Polysphondylium violaceum]|uniref:WD40 repeat-containing protein n=1 Tax=Polysphondylium violaceum TaxID=133409 RepID=A0A8J4PZJ2_9MYCE|nr:hypothetical protein CYY_003549 [Polysphondylium violaceum]
MLDIKSIYRKEIEYDFNVLIVGEIFKSTNKHLLIGGVDGKIRVYLNKNEVETLETKAGAIQHLELFDTTRFGSIDIISGDNSGNVIIFSNHQILYKDTLNGSVTSIVTHQSSNNDFCIAVGNNNGIISTMKPHQPLLWKYQLPLTSAIIDTLSQSDVLRDSRDNLELYRQHQINSEGLGSGGTSEYKSVVQIKSVKGLDSFNNDFSFLIVSENTCFVHIIDQGKTLCSIPTPSPVNCMCVGYFDSRYSSDKQIALGCENGFVYILHDDFKLDLYCQIGYPITSLLKLNTSDIKKEDNNNSNSNDEDSDSDNSDSLFISGKKIIVDYLFCTGNFNSLKVLKDRNMITEYKTDDWIHTLSIGDVENNSEKMIVIGKLNNTIEFLKISE